MIWMTLVVSIRADFRAIRISVLRSRDLAGKNASPVTEVSII
jgi:hypothetical protein